MRTEIFPDYDAFLARPDKKVNGVSPGAAARYPDYEKYNDSNEGCWECIGCTDCKYSIHCGSSHGCVGSTFCVFCTGCENCAGCLGCDVCTNCTECIECVGCTDCAYSNELTFSVGIMPLTDSSALS